MDSADPSFTIPSFFGGYGPPARFRQRNKPADAYKYDFRVARTHLRHTNNVVESAIHLLMCGMGSGLIVLHALYQEGGMWTGVALNIILATMVSYCTCMLVWSAQKLYGRVLMPQLSFPDIVEATVLLSPWPKFRRAARGFRYSIEGFLLLHLYGSCCVYVIMIGRNLKELVEGDEIISDAGDPPLRVYILSLLLPCFVICMLTDLKNLAPFALICNVYAVAIVLVTMWYGLRTKTESPFVRPGFKSIMGLFQSFGVNVFILDIITYALPVENNMEQPKKFHYVVLIAMPIYTAAMLLIGIVGYWHWGEVSLSPITIHFPFSPFPVQLKVFLCLILYVIFSISFYIAFDIEWFYLRRNHRVVNYWFWERFYRMFHVILVVLIAFGMPNVTRLMGCIGGLCTSFIIFIYPPVIELILDWQHPGLGRYKWRLIKSISMLILALLIISGGSFYNVYGMILESINMGSHIGRNITVAKEYVIYKDLERPADYNVTFKP